MVAHNCFHMPLRVFHPFIILFLHNTKSWSIIPRDAVRVMSNLHTHIEVTYASEVFAYIFMMQVKAMILLSIESLIFNFPSHSSGFAQFFDVGLIWDNAANGDE